MHTQTHILSGWCVGSLFGLTARERLFCMMAASLADLDGVSGVFGEMAFAEYHHRLSHNVFFALLMAGVLVCLSRHRFKGALLYLGLFHLHVLMDHFGSGRSWTIYYLWPVSEWELKSRYAWALYSWQNLSMAGGVVVWTVLIAIFQGRTPLEAMMPNLDRQLVDWLRRRAGRRVDA
ncbi:MAG: metal-dependent hydrolase [Bacillota bacterium]